MHSALLRHYQVPRTRNAWLPLLLASGVNVLLLLALTWLQRGRPADTNPLRVRPAVLRDVVRPRPLRVPVPPRPEPPKRPPESLKLPRPKPAIERPKPQFAPMQAMLLKADLTPLKLRDALDVPVVVPPADAEFQTSAPVATPHRPGTASPPPTACSLSPSLTVASSAWDRRRRACNSLARGTSAIRTPHGAGH